jgi:hypothetical protein
MAFVTRTISSFWLMLLLKSGVMPKQITSATQDADDADNRSVFENTHKVEPPKS